MFGPPVPMQRQGTARWSRRPTPAGSRRSVYLQVRRSQPLTILQVFDQPVMETNCTRRADSTVSSQALTLLNSDFMTRQADAFAARVLKEQPGRPGRLRCAAAFGRPITAKEKATLTAFLDEQAKQYDPEDAGRDGRRALADLCHMLLSANEFAYVD